jgi:hypothetical protein
VFGNRRRAWPLALTADALVVLIFATVGRATHDEPVTVAGVWHVAWPFLVGTAVAWAVTAYTRADPLGVGTGVRVWLWTLIIGMVGRRALGEGTAPDFVVVAALVLCALFVGWRLVRRVRQADRWARPWRS